MIARINNNMIKRRVYGQFRDAAHVRAFAIEHGLFEHGMSEPTTIRKIGEFVWECYYTKQKMCSFCFATDCNKYFVVGGRLTCSECRELYKDMARVIKRRPTTNE